MVENKYKNEVFPGYEKKFIRNFTSVFVLFIILFLVGYFGSEAIGILLGVKSGNILGVIIGIAFLSISWIFIWFLWSIKTSKCPRCSGNLKEAKDTGEWVLVCHQCEVNWLTKISKDN